MPRNNTLPQHRTLLGLGAIQATDHFLYSCSRCTDIRRLCRYNENSAELLPISQSSNDQCCIDAHCSRFDLLAWRRDSFNTAMRPLKCLLKERLLLYPSNHFYYSTDSFVMWLRVLLYFYYAKTLKNLLSKYVHASTIQVFFVLAVFKLIAEIFS